jgi:hypothetical protein
MPAQLTWMQHLRGPFTRQRSKNVPENNIITLKPQSERFKELNYSTLWFKGAMLDLLSCFNRAKHTEFPDLACGRDQEHPVGSSASICDACSQPSMVVGYCGKYPTGKTTNKILSKWKLGVYFGDF